MKKYLCLAVFVWQIMSLPLAQAAEQSTAVTPKLSSADALKKLIEGNQRFMDDKISCEERFNERRAALISKQDPFGIVLGCSDSRVPLELVFDQGVGDLFVVRVAGNVAGSTELESLEYALKHLNSVIILVLGHEGCAAVAAVLNNEAKDFPEIAALIEPAVKSIRDKKSIEQAVKANVRVVVDTIKKSKILNPIIQENNISVVGGYYHLESGRVEILQP